MKDWVTVSIGELCLDIKSGGTPLTSVEEYYANGNIYWLKTKEILNNRVFSTESKITAKGLENSSAKLIPINSVIIAMYGDGGTAGRVAINKVPLTTNQACCNLIIDDLKANYEYIFYYLLGSYNELVGLKTGSGQQNLSTKIIKEFQIKLPTLLEQRAIASVLSSLDDKIDLLHRQNKTLEALAETLFRQWFVEETQENWEEMPLDEIANFMNGLPLQKFPPTGFNDLPVIKIRELRQGFTETTDRANRSIPPQYLISDGDILFSWSGSLEVIIWGHGEGALNQHLFKITSDTYPKWFYYLATKYHLQEFRQIASDKATTMGHIQRHHLADALIATPPSETIEELGQYFAPLIEKIIVNNEQIRTLTSLRNTLLPKLMSGEVRVQYEEQADTGKQKNMAYNTQQELPFGEAIAAT